MKSYVRHHRSLIVLAAVCVVTACTSPPPTPPPSESPSSVTASTTASSSPSTSSTPAYPDDDGGAPTAPPPAGDDNRAHAAAVAAAAFRAYIARDRSPQAWIDGLAPFLSQQARDDYAFTDPREVPARRVLGAPIVVPTDAVALARIHILADDGTWLITLSRTTSQDWRVERFTPPDGGEL